MELATIIEHYQDALYARYGAQITPEQERALGAILDCHTARYGEMVLNCDTCNQQQRCFHSCGHWVGHPGAAKHREVRERPSELSLLSTP